MANKAFDRGTSRKRNGKKEKGTGKKANKQPTEYQRERASSQNGPKRKHGRSSS